MEGKIIRETDKSYLVEKPDGKKVYVCKLCGAEFESLVQLAQHFASKHRNTDQHSEAEEDNTTEPETTEETETTSQPRLTKEGSKPHKILTPEEEMLEEMAKTLYEQMRATPGIGSSEKVDWFVNQFFRRVKRLQEDEKALFMAIKRYFPKADDDSIALIVDSVFEIKKQYERKLSSPPFFSPSAPQPQTGFYMPSFRQTPTQTPTDPMTMMMMRMMDYLFRKLDEIDRSRQGYSPEEIQRYIEAEVEKRLLKEQLDMLQRQLEQQNKMLQDILNGKLLKRPSSDGWSDDYARLIAELGNRFLELTEQILIENRKTRQLIIKHVIPQLVNRRVEASGKIEQHEPTGAGVTDEEIVTELEKEGLVEEE